MQTTVSPLSLTSAFCSLLILPQIWLLQKSAFAEAPPATTQLMVVEGRAHYSFTSPDSETVQSGSSQAVRLEYDRYDMIPAVDTSAAEQDSVITSSTDERISEERISEDVARKREKML